MRLGARGAAALLVVAILAGCCRTPVPDRTAAARRVPTDAWIGRWVGVEGLALDIRPRDAAGTYRLHVALMDGSADYAGQADGDVIRFRRDGRRATIRHVPGSETGLKWLAEKHDCLMIQPGEGFCRD